MQLKLTSAAEHKSANGQNIFGQTMLANPAAIVPGGTTSCFASCCSTCTCGVLMIAPLETV